MKKIIVAGAGFSGLGVLEKVSSRVSRKEWEILLIDKSRVFNFLPVLPDVIGRGINPVNITSDIAGICRKRGVQFINENVESVDLDSKVINTSSQKLIYDYLVIASGSETNFYGSQQIPEIAYKLDDAADAKLIRDSLASSRFESVLIAGGGYTGIEIATNICRYLQRNKINKRVVIIERAAAILGPLPGWIKGYVLKNLRDLKVEIITNTAIDKAQAGSVTLANGLSFNNPMLIWAAGVKTADYIQKMPADKNPQGRIKVDKFLKINDSCFVVGDASFVQDKGAFLRMAVQFAISEGEITGINILRSINKKKLLEFKPVDFGYIIPMANNKGCGEILGVKVKGVLAVFLHYFMCIYRSVGFKNRLGLFLDILK